MKKNCQSDMSEIREKLGEFGNPKSNKVYFALLIFIPMYLIFNLEFLRLIWCLKCH